MTRLRTAATLLLALLLATGCTTVEGPREKKDPFESFNRSMYTFNDTLDRAILKPVAEGYQYITPQPVDDAVTNFFSNLDDVTVLFNDILQLKIGQGVHDFFRIGINTTLGLLGLFDVASHLDLPKHNEDFGQTLGYWGVPTGPYLVLPLLGPSTIRDGVGTAVDWETDPLVALEDPYAKWGSIGLKYVDKRADLLRASRILDTAALDPYIFLRDAYLQRRESLVYDGNPPMPDFDEMFEDEPPFDEEPPADEVPADTPADAPAP